MLVKIELDLKDAAQMDLLLEIMALVKQSGFHCGASDALRKRESVRGEGCGTCGESHDEAEYRNHNFVKREKSK